MASKNQEDSTKTPEHGKDMLPTPPAESVDLSRADGADGPMFFPEARQDVVTHESETPALIKQEQDEDDHHEEPITPEQEGEDEDDGGMAE